MHALICKHTAKVIRHSQLSLKGVHAVVVHTHTHTHTLGNVELKKQ